MALTYAQAPIAMLQHGTNLTPFYGNDALINAYNAAQDEDIITLSPPVSSTPVTSTKPSQCAALA